MPIIPIRTLSQYLLVPNGILRSIQLNLEMRIIETEHLIIGLLWLQLSELVNLIMLVLFGQLDSQVGAIVLWV